MNFLRCTYTFIPTRDAQLTLSTSIPVLPLDHHAEHNCGPTSAWERVGAQSTVVTKQAQPRAQVPATAPLLSPSSLLFTQPMRELSTVVLLAELPRPCGPQGPGGQGAASVACIRGLHPSIQQHPDFPGIGRFCAINLRPWASTFDNSAGRQRHEKCGVAIGTPGIPGH